MTQPRNLLVAQSGGPTAVINNSLRGLVETARDLPDIATIYAGWHGIEGVLHEELLNLSAQDPREIALLSNTPAAGSVGTCRYKLCAENEQDFARVLDVFRAHDIGYFCYIGGNDSMDTANKVSRLALDTGFDLVCVGVPKTIDNDVGDTEFQLIDHTPGYGSTARYWTHLVQSANEENRGSCRSDPVLVLQAMGRRIGFIPAAARLADPNRQWPLQIYLAERTISAEELADNVNDQLRRDGRVIVVVSEGLTVGEIGESRDAFGHTQFSSSQTTVAQLVINLLNEKGLPVKGAARANVPGTDQRHNTLSTSTIDLDEAYAVGRQAALLAAAGEDGFMATLLRENGPGYKVRYDKVLLETVANSERQFPQTWIAQNGYDVTDDFVKYATPLIGDASAEVPIENGRLRFARLSPLFAEQQLPKYVPQADRK